MNIFKTLTGKVLTAVGTSLVVLFLGQWSIARHIILNSYQRLEMEQAGTDAERLTQALVQELNSLATSSEDWAWWDNTYEFVQDSNSDYAKANLSLEAIKTLSIDFLVIFNREQQVVYGQMLAPDSTRLQTIPPTIINELTQYAPRLQPKHAQKSRSGFAIVNQQPTLLTIQQILTTAHEGPSQGTFMMGRFINNNLVDTFSETTRLPVDAFVFNDPQLPADLQTVKADIAQTGNNLSIQILDNQHIASYAIIPDLLEQPGLILKAHQPREIYGQGQSSLHYYAWSTAIIGVLFGLITLGLLRWLILKRLSHLSYQVSHIGTTHQDNVHIPGNDELTQLAHTINWTLNQLRQRTDELERAKQTADVAKEKADAANKAKSVFLANMSHELRTPLNAILGFGQILKRDRTLQTQHQEKLDIINRSSEHLLTLINDVLDMSKIEAGHPELNTNSFDLYQLLENLKELFTPKAHAKGIQLTIEYNANLPQYINTDERKLRQVLLNLLSNAIKFTHEGHIELSAESMPLLDSPHKAEQSIIYLSFSVIDTGIGIAQEKLTDIFQPFTQAVSGQQAEEGTGLGLAISQQFVELMGGSLSVTSQLDQGSTFTFGITAGLANALDVEAANTPQLQVTGLEPRQPAYRILIVDDRELNRRLLTDLLTPIGFEVREAENGAIAVEQWKTWQPHLIWMDMRMPVMDGYAATREIRSYLKGRTVTIIALTASTLEEDKDSTLDAGCNDFVMKPFKHDIIFRKMAKHLGVRYLYEATHDNHYNTDVVPEMDTGSITSAMEKQPKEWLQQMHQTTIQLKYKESIFLLEQLPQSHARLRQVIEEKIHNFDFEQVATMAMSALEHQEQS